MPELRQNMVTKEWVIIASERAKRPDQFASKKQATTETGPFYDPTCPFCPGNEELDLEVERMPETGPWQTRVVQNRFPALSNANGELERVANGVYRCISGVGHHEVLVEHPRHNTTMALMTPEEIKAILETFYSRGWGICKDNRVEQIVYFKNHGESAGASLKHPHCQIIALPVVPTDIRHRIEEARRYFDDHGKCVLCDMMQRELEAEERVVIMSEHFVAFILYAAPSPFHIWIVPRQHNVSFLFSQPEELMDLAHILRDVVRRLYIGLGDPSYNLIIRSAPVREISSEYLHWYIAVVPRLSRTAGFELGSGVYINTAIPEESTAFLRKVKI